LNDINGDLVTLYRVIQHHLEEFVRQFKWALSSRQVYEWEKAKAPETLTDIQRAARFYYLQKQAFGGRVDGQNYGTATTTRPRLDILRIEEDLSQAWQRLQGTYVENLSWSDVIVRYDRPHTLFYLDPPYWETAGYGVEFEWGNFELMAKLAREVDGAMIISINDHPDIRAVFDGLHMESVAINYTVGGGKGSAAKELIIWNDQCEQGRKETVTLELF
ncbi:MAG: DNA adenine methylase, partial [Gammaproteobacteria bacterium]|nr:DNA adenine methylase [Gammaproteobacteria bacterium]